jgi:hypothetical protein
VASGICAASHLRNLFLHNDLFALLSIGPQQRVRITGSRALEEGHPADRTRCGCVWAFPMISRIFNSFDSGSFERLIGIGQFFKAFISRFVLRRRAVEGSGTAWTYLSWIVALLFWHARIRAVRPLLCCLNEHLSKKGRR